MSSMSSSTDASDLVQSRSTGADKTGSFSHFRLKTVPSKAKAALVPSGNPTVCGSGAPALAHANIPKAISRKQFHAANPLKRLEAGQDALLVGICGGVVLPLAFRDRRRERMRTN